MLLGGVRTNFCSYARKNKNLFFLAWETSPRLHSLVPDYTSLPRSPKLKKLKWGGGIRYLLKFRSRPLDVVSPCSTPTSRCTSGSRYMSPAVGTVNTAPWGLHLLPLTHFQVVLRVVRAVRLAVRRLHSPPQLPRRHVRLAEPSSVRNACSWGPTGRSEAVVTVGVYSRFIGFRQLLTRLLKFGW